MKKLMLAALAAMGLAGGALAAATTVAVSEVKASQRFPWNGWVDIDCTVTCSDPTADIALSVSATDKATGRALSIHRIWHENDSTHTNLITVKAGKHRLVWDARQDEPNLVSGNVAFDVQAFVGRSFYMVIDLSGGTNATHYPITYLNQVPAGGWTSEYKLDKLVMRLIPPGTFTMGSPEGGERNRGGWEVQHQVTITKPYYMGVFEVTQRQYERVMGYNPSANIGEIRPVEQVTWNTIRGDRNFPATLAIDDNSFMGRLRTRTGLPYLDLPTEAEWEYACRAGTTTAINDGSSTWSGGYSWNDQMNAVGRYSGNSGVGTAAVGSYIPNRWGLYDMHGNVWEWCLDWYGYYITTVRNDPVGATGGGVRCVRGGSYNNYAMYCRSACRGWDDNTCHQAYAACDVGFRLCCETVSK